MATTKALPISSEIFVTYSLENKRRLQIPQTNELSVFNTSHFNIIEAKNKLRTKQKFFENLFKRTL